MISHIRTERRYGNTTLFDCLVVRAFRRARLEILLTNPIVGFSSRVDVFADHWTCVLNSLPRHAYTFDFTAWKIDVEQRTFRQPLAQDLPHRCHREARRL